MTTPPCCRTNVTFLKVRPPHLGWIVGLMLSVGLVGRAVADEPLFADPAEAETWAWLLGRSGRAQHIERDSRSQVKWVGLRDEKNERGDYYTGSVDLDQDGRVIKMTFNAPHLTNDDLQRLTAFRRLRQLTTWHNGWVKSADKSPYSGAGLRHLAELPLRAFNIGGSWFNDEGMAAANELPLLEVLEVGHTQVTDAGVKALRGNAHLKRLALGPQYSQRITEGCLAHVATLPELEDLELNEVLLSWDGGLRHLESLSNRLKRLKLEHVLVSDDDLAKLKSALRHTTIDCTPAAPEHQRQMQAAAARTTR